VVFSSFFGASVSTFVFWIQQSFFFPSEFVKKEQRKKKGKTFYCVPKTMTVSQKQ